MADLKQCLIGRWLHSHEEDGEGLQIYRPASYKFPPARGRRGLEFRDGGELVYIGIARTDGAEPMAGAWTIEGNERVRVSVTTGSVQPYTLHVVSCTNDMLKVRRLD
jgi:hypothetical protein